MTASLPRATASPLEREQSETAAFAEGEGVGEAAGRNAERGDVLAFLRRKRINAALIAERTPEFAEGARQTMRELDILHDHIAGGLHEGAAFTTAVLSGEVPCQSEA